MLAHSKFDFDVIYNDNVINFQEKFDAIYFDGFSDLYTEQTLQAAALMLKSGGKLMTTYRENGNGIDLSKELSDVPCPLVKNIVVCMKRKY